MSYLCPRCGSVSQHPEDERNGYCGGCHDYTALKAGDVVRIRRIGSTDAWCMCSVLLASTNGESIALRVTDGALRTQGGGLITGAIAMRVAPKVGAFELFTNTELEVEGRA